MTQRSPGRLLALPVAASPAAARRLAPVIEALRADTPDTLAAWLGAPPDRDRHIDAELVRLRPDVVLVAGDGDAAVSGALAARRRGVPVVRLGAGLRCGDRTVEKEANRIVLDGLAARLYADGEDAVENLLAEGVDERRVVCCGSTAPEVVGSVAADAVAIDLLVALHRRPPAAEARFAGRLTRALAGLAPGARIVLCPPAWLHAALEAAGDLRALERAGVTVAGRRSPGEFLRLLAAAAAVVTDSGGVQEEASVLGVPCYTLSHTTERTMTVRYGTNALLGDDPAEIGEVVPAGGEPPTARIPGWDGRAAARIAADLTGGALA